MVVMRVKVILCLICILQFMACGNSTRSNSEYVPVKDYHTVEVDDKDHGDVYDDSTPDIGSIRLTGEIVQCNKCMGYGLVQDGLYGQPQICKFC